MSTNFGDSCSASEAIDDRDVEEGDGRKLSLGETHAELSVEESVGIFRFSGMR